MKLMHLHFIFIFNLMTPIGYAQFATQDANTRRESDMSEEELERMRQQGNNYINTTLEQKAYEENCIDENGELKNNCNQATMNMANPDPGLMNWLERHTPLAEQFYTLFGGMASKMGGGGGLKLTEKRVNKKIQKAGKKDVKESRADYCQYIPMIKEMIEKFNLGQQSQQIQDNVSESSENAQTTEQTQRFALEGMASMLAERKESSYRTAGVWAATTVCYSTMIATGVKASFQVIAKLAASTFFSTFYWKLGQAFKLREEAVRKIAEKFPMAGECSPQKNPSCFCSLPQSKIHDQANYQIYCVAPVFKENDKRNKSSCVDQNGNHDKNCFCKIRGGCIMAKLGPVMLSEGFPGNVVKNIDRATEDDGLNPFAFLGPLRNKSMAMAKRAMSKYNPNDGPKNITPKNSSVQLLHQMGVPSALAAQLSALPSTHSALPIKSALGALEEDVKKNTQESIKKAKFAKKGSRYRSRRRSSRGSSGRRGAQAGGIEISDFAAKAAREAEITKDKSVSIFEILGKRYSKKREFLKITE